MKKLQELTLFDKFLFDETMDIPEAHEAVLQIIFGDDNLKLLTPAQTEKEIRTAPWLTFIILKICLPALRLDVGQCLTIRISAFPTDHIP